MFLLWMLTLVNSDWFLDLLSAEAEKLIDQLKERPQYVLNVSQDWWITGLPRPLNEKTMVYAVDGGGGIQPLAGGGAIYIARAFAYAPNQEPERLLELKFYPTRDTRVLDALRSLLEHRVAVRTVLKRQPPVLLIDGSYRATILTTLATIYRAASSRLHSLSLLYAALLSMELLITVEELARLALENNVVVAYVSKDHAYRVLKEKILLEAIAQVNPCLRKLIEQALAWYPLGEREKLLAIRRKLGIRERGLLDVALDMSYRDTQFIVDTIGVTIGFTLPLRVPPPHQLHKMLTYIGLKHVVERLCSNMEKYLGDNEASICWTNAERLVTALDQLPAPLFIYVRLDPNDTPLLVELFAAPGSIYSPGRILEEPSEPVERVLAALVRDYAGPDYYNIPLIAAHLNATLSGSQMLAYMRLLESLAAARGVQLKFARRSIIGRRLTRAKKHRLLR
ncbi:MAG TPA: DNA double-strand break repair nuclease NurA [Pyrodictiaceae archaeon]|nr:DNA double-strand break repair nuclease NurA [Pyrodictiaceae archaeon]HIQ56381.1 DNA double-strand break repair nuclease NurA [Pyrodictium sp.]